MHAGYNNRNVIVDTIEDPIGKSAQEHAVGVSMDRGVSSRMRGDLLQRGLNGLQELIPQTAAPFFVPQKRLLDIRSRRRPDNESPHGAQPRIR